MGAVLKAGHIPAGMELFTAGDRSQMATIKEWIISSEEMRLPNNKIHIGREKLTIRHMITIYCRGHRHSISGTCADCGAILRYAYDLIDKCQYNGSVKPACGLCRTNCFMPDMYRRFTQIMRYAGPRMLVRHPILTMAHLWDAVRGRARSPRP